MARECDRLTAVQVRQERKPGRHADGGGLYLFVKPDGRRTWVFRYTDRRTGKQRDMGIGNAVDVTLAHARKRAHEARLLLLDHGDPIEARGARAEAARIERANRLTFAQCAEQYIAAHRAGWRNAKHAEQWTATLETYGKPINPLPVADIDTALVLKCLQPYWTEKAETMTRVRQRIESVLDWATVRGYRKGENPARWRGHLDKLLPKRSKVKTVVHRPALAYAEMYEFMIELRQRNSLAARALELQILTATRPGGPAGAQWSEIDSVAETWTIPKGRMKAHKEHTVPLTKAAQALLRALPRINSFVFASVKGKPITTAAGQDLLKEMRPGFTAHGFRSTFRDWAGDKTAHPREIIEHALAHQLKDKAEAAYSRSSALERRAQLMADWASYLDTPPAGAIVTPDNGREGDA